MDRREFVTAKKKIAPVRTNETKETVRTFSGLTPIMAHGHQMK
jgi:hypothetical protein